MHFKSRLEFRLSIARKKSPEVIDSKWEKYLGEYVLYGNHTITDKMHFREAMELYMNYKCKCKKE